MHDDDDGDFGRSCFDDADGENAPSTAQELFGEFSVLSPGVQIVLDGRPVSHVGH